MANLFDAPWVVKFCPFSQKNDFLGGGTISEEVVEEKVVKLIGPNSLFGFLDLITIMTERKQFG